MKKKDYFSVACFFLFLLFIVFVVIVEILRDYLKSLKESVPR